MGNFRFGQVRLDNFHYFLTNFTHLPACGIGAGPGVGFGKKFYPSGSPCSPVW